VRLRALTLALAIALAAAPIANAAEPVTPAARAAARDLAAEGSQLYRDGEYDEALDRYERAYAVLRVPSLGFWSARCLEELGQWVRASERYREVTQLPLPKRSPELHREVQTDAAAKLQALEKRIPKLRIVIVGASSDAVQVSVDGEAVPSVLVDRRLPVDLGEHRVVGVMGEGAAARSVEQSVVVNESEERRVELVFETAPAPVAAPAPQAASQPKVAAPVNEPPPADEVAQPSSVLSTLGRVGVGVGAAGIVFGVVTVAWLANLDGTLDEHCVEELCRPTANDDVDTYNTLRPLPAVGFVVGGVVMAAGITALLLAPDRAESASIQPLVGPGYLGVVLRGM
jgi:hypothetical protein